MAERREDYEVGYGKPPKHSRFQPGRSGNPKGSPKGKRGLKTDLAAVVEERQTIQINKQAVTDTRQRLAMRTLATRAAAGDLKAIALLSSLILQVLGIEDRGVDHRKLSSQDQAILDQLLLYDDGQSLPDEADRVEADGVAGD